MGVVKEDYGYFPMIFLSIFTDDVQNIQYWLAFFLTVLPMCDGENLFCKRIRFRKTRISAALKAKKRSTAISAVERSCYDPNPGALFPEPFLDARNMLGRSANASQAS